MSRETAVASRESRVAKAARAGLLLGAVLVALAYASAWFGAARWGSWSMIVGAALCMSAATAMGAANSHVRPARVLVAASVVFTVIVVGFGAPFFLPAVSPGAALFLGLPLPVAIEVYGVGLLPILVLPVLFAADFNADGLDEIALAELKRQCAAVRPS